MTQIFDRDQIVREFALTFIANTQKKSIRVYARKLWYHTCTQASHNRSKHWFNLRKSTWTWKMEGFWDNTQDCNFINHWTTKVGLKKPKCTMQTVVMCKSTVLWCMSNDLQYIDGKKEDISSVCAAWRISHGLDVTFWACPRNIDICRRKERKKMRQQYRYSNNMSS